MYHDFHKKLSVCIGDHSGTSLMAPGCCQDTPKSIPDHRFSRFFVIFRKSLSYPKGYRFRTDAGLTPSERASNIIMVHVECLSCHGFHKKWWVSKGGPGYHGGGPLFGQSGAPCEPWGECFAPCLCACIILLFGTSSSSHVGKPNYPPTASRSHVSLVSPVFGGHFNPQVNRQSLFPWGRPEELVRTRIYLDIHCSMWSFYWNYETFTGPRGMARANNVPHLSRYTPVWLLESLCLG